MRDLMVARSDCEWVLPLDDCDLLDPVHVEIGSTHLDTADIVYSWCRVEQGLPPNRLFNPKALIRYNYIPVTALIRKNLLDNLGGFQHNNHWQLWLRALKMGARFRCIPEVTWTWRLQQYDLANAAIAEHRADQKPAELNALVAILRNRSIKTVLEIGTAGGGTLWLWSQLADPDALLISVDLPGAAFDSGQTDRGTLMSKVRATQKLHLIREDSNLLSTLRKVQNLLKNRTVDVLFIDGDHTEQGVTKDYELYSPLLSDDGVIVFHDIAKHDQKFYPGANVDKFWNNLQGNKTELIDYTNHDKPGGAWGGIGIVYSRLV